MRLNERPGMLVAVSLILGGLLGGCAAATRNPVPEHLAYSATIPGLEQARFIGDQQVAEITLIKVARLRDSLEAQRTWNQPQRFLSISGGGAKGAFTAGLLKGWTDARDRPEFLYVTGISTGALIAPFAFLGSDYDDELETAYTTLSTRDLLKSRGKLAAFTSDAMASTERLAEFIKRVTTDEIIDAIGREHQRGRRLYIGTTHLDLMEPTYWDIGMIASSDFTGRYDLIRKIMLASASIPAAFPPQMFTVEAEGKSYDEMHVDGGATTQVFCFPISLELPRLLEAGGVKLTDPRVYVIRNSTLGPEYEPVKRKLLPIAGRAISSLIKTQGIGDLYETYFASLRDDVDFNLAYIPSEFDVESKEAFDPEYMRALFDVGYEMARNGYPWLKQPPNVTWPSDAEWRRTMRELRRAPQ